MSTTTITKRTTAERLSVIEEIVTRMDERLFGNGQPGEIEKMNKRLRFLEQWFWRSLGAISLGIALLEWVHKS